MIVWIWILVLLVALMLYFRQVYSRFNRYGVKYSTPIPLLGSMTRIIFRLDHFAENTDRYYHRYRNERFIGKYEFVKPVLTIHDLDLIKKIAVKDFEHFLDHRPLVDDKLDPLFGRNLLALKGQEWKDMRSTLSPAFTSSKIRVMVPFMMEVGDQMIEVLKKKMKASRDGYIDVEAIDLMSRYANDVIASCAFGLKVNSHSDEQNQFYEMGKEASNFKFKQIMILLAYSSMPALIKKFKFTLFSKQVQSFFRKLVGSTMEDRENRKIIRPDMIHLLMEAKKVWSDDDLTAQAILFFIAGFETISTAMTFLLYELAINPDIQEKLYQEIMENETNNGGKFDYNSIQQMTYLDMVVSEILRLWLPGVVLDRICIKDYNLGRANEEATEDYIIRKGEALQIPAWSIHRDPKYFPNPLKFDPERFSEDNKHNIQPFAYIPFGLGPRNCIGSRFALCEVKVMAYQLLRAIELSASAKTQIPVKLAKNTFNIRIEGGHWIRFRSRN